MLFELFSATIVDLLFAALFVILYTAWKKLAEQLMQQISESTTRRELVIWIILYVVASITLFTAEVFIIATVWEVLF